MSPVTPRPYNGQGYSRNEESENQTQDAMSQNGRGRQQQNPNQNQQNQKQEPKTIASGRASDMIQPGQRRRPKTPQNPMMSGMTSPQPTPIRPQNMRGNNIQPTQNILEQNNNTTTLEPIGHNPDDIKDTTPVEIIEEQPKQEQEVAQAQPANPEQDEFANRVQDDSRPMNATSNKVNIAQILKDFRNTISAVGTPDVIREEVEDYINMVEEHTKGEAPSIQYVQTNLLNGAAVMDKFISETLNKESKVVVKWLEALFLQRINYHYNDGEVNKAFLVKFPKSEEEKQKEEEEAKQAEAQKAQEQPIQAQQIAQEQPVITQPQPQIQRPQYAQNPIQRRRPPVPKPMPIQPQPEPVLEQPKEPIRVKPEYKIIPEDTELKSLFIQAKKHVFAKNPAKAMDMFYRALTRAEAINDCETQSKICLEMGKIYDDNNYVVQALSSYNKSLKTTTDTNTKTLAHYSMAQIYDNVEQTAPAIAHYMTSVSYAGENDNLVSQSTSLTKIGNIFTRYEDEKAFEFYDEANVLVYQTADAKTKGYVSCNTADAYDKFNKPTKALSYYADAVKNYTEAKEVENIAENYKKAGELMLTLHNPAKAKVLLRKALLHADRIKDNELVVEINQIIRDIAA